MFWQRRHIQTQLDFLRKKARTSSCFKALIHGVLNLEDAWSLEGVVEDEAPQPREQQ
jgi:hypothetical protein